MQVYGLPPGNADILLVATRHVGSSLFPISEWPVSVHVVVPLVDKPAQVEALNSDQFKEIAWAELYKSEEDARSSVTGKR
jgi:hypothetical protein